MIPGHQYLSMIIPPEERIAVVGFLIIGVVVVSYLMVKGLIAYTEWRNAQIKEV